MLLMIQLALSQDARVQLFRLGRGRVAFRKFLRDP